MRLAAAGLISPADVPRMMWRRLKFITASMLCIQAPG